MRSVSRPISFAARTPCWGGARLFASLIVAAVCGTLTAEEVPLKYEPARKRDRFEVLQILRDGTPLSQEQQPKFAEYFNFFVLPPFAMPQKETELPQQRAEIRKYFATAKIGPPYDELNKLVMNYMQAVILNNPRVKSHAARYNAVLVIGDLNSFEGGTRGGKLPKPLPEALEVLVKLLKDEKQPPYIHIAALIGIQRHAALNSSYPIEETAKITIAKAMLQLLQKSQPPATASASGHAYLRATAADILAQFNDSRVNDVLLTAIQKALEEPEAPRAMKMSLCGTVGLIEVPKTSKVDLAQLAGSVGRASIAACEEELERTRAQELERQQAVDPDRRRLSYFLHQAEVAFKGLPGKPGGLIAGAEGTPNGSQIAQFGKDFSRLVKELEDLGAEDYVSREEWQTKLAELKAALPGASKTARVPAESTRDRGVAGASK